jgi:hypothetical protein
MKGGSGQLNRGAIGLQVKATRLTQRQVASKRLQHAWGQFPCQVIVKKGGQLLASHVCTSGLIASDAGFPVDPDKR